MGVFFQLEEVQQNINIQLVLFFWIFPQFSMGVFTLNGFDGLLRARQHGASNHRWTSHVTWSRDRFWCGDDEIQMRDPQVTRGFNTKSWSDFGWFKAVALF
jgi:hypothetical protein